MAAAADVFVHRHQKYPARKHAAFERRFLDRLSETMPYLHRVVLVHVEVAARV